MPRGLPPGSKGSSNSDPAAPFSEYGRVASCTPRPVTVSRRRRRTSTRSRPHAATRSMAGPGRIEVGVRGVGGGASGASRRFASMAASIRSAVTPRGISWATNVLGNPATLLPVQAKAASSSAMRCFLLSTTRRMTFHARSPVGSTLAGGGLDEVWRFAGAWRRGLRDRPAHTVFQVNRS